MPVLLERQQLCRPHRYRGHDGRPMARAARTRFMLMTGYPRIDAVTLVHSPGAAQPGSGVYPLRISTTGHARRLLGRGIDNGREKRTETATKLPASYG